MRAFCVISPLVHFSLDTPLVEAHNLTMNNTANTETAMSQYKLLGVSKQTGATIYKHPEGHIIAIKKDSYGTKWEHHSADRSMSTGSYSGFKDLTDHVNKFHEAKQ